MTRFLPAILFSGATGCGGPLGVLSVSFDLAPVPAEDLPGTIGTAALVAISASSGSVEIEPPEGMGMVYAHGLPELEEDSGYDVEIGFAEDPRAGLATAGEEGGQDEDHAHEGDGHDEEPSWVQGGSLFPDGDGEWSNMFVDEQVAPLELGAVRAARIVLVAADGSSVAVLEGEAETEAEAASGGGHAH